MSVRQWPFLLSCAVGLFKPIQNHFRLENELIFVVFASTNAVQNWQADVSPV